MPLSHKYESTVRAKGGRREKVYYPHCYVEIQAIKDDNNSHENTVVTGNAQQTKNTGPNIQTTGTIQVPVFSVEPIDCRIYLNNNKDADTFSITLDAKRCPFEFKQFKMIGVKIYLYQTKRLLAQDQDDFYKTAGTSYGESLVLVGLVDELEYEEETGEQGGLYHLSGLDLTGLMLKAFPTQKKVVYQGSTFSDTIQNLVDLACNWSQYDKTGNHIIPGPARQTGLTGTLLGVRLKVGFLDPQNGWIELDKANKDDFSNAKDNTLIGGNVAPPVLKNKTTKTGKKIKQSKINDGTQKINHKGQSTIKGQTYWDVITLMCVKKGYEVYIRGYQVIIADPLASIEASQATDSRQKYHMALKEDVKKYTFKRKLTKKPVPQIKVWWYNKNGKNKNQLDEAVYPPDTSKGAPQQQLVNGILVEQNQVIEIPLAYCNDKTTATRVAMYYYNDISRGEATITLTTNDLFDLSDDQLDLLKLRTQYTLKLINNDPWRYQNRDRYLKYDTNKRRIEAGTSFGLSTYDVHNLVNNFKPEQDVDDDREYYVKGVIFKWSIKTGIEVDIEIQNFINPNLDQTLKDIKK